MKVQANARRLQVAVQEKQINPFYLTLKAQKEEREAFIMQHQLALIDSPKEERTEEPDCEVFKHTYVEIDEDQFKKSEREPKQDLFCFFDLRVTLPKNFMDKLGQADVVSPIQSVLMQEFIMETWPAVSSDHSQLFSCNAARLPGEWFRILTGKLSVQCQQAARHRCPSAAKCRFVSSLRDNSVGRWSASTTCVPRTRLRRLKSETASTQCYSNQRSTREHSKVT